MVGNPSEVKVMVDLAREITQEHLKEYEPTGKSLSAKASGPSATITPPVENTDTQAAEQVTLERVYIKLEDTGDEKKLLSLKQAIDTHQGETEVVLVVGEAAHKQAIKLPGGIDRDSEGLETLKELVGTENLVVK